MEQFVKLEQCDMTFLVESSQDTMCMSKTILQSSVDAYGPVEVTEECLGNLETEVSELTQVFTCWHCNSTYATKSDIHMHLLNGYCSGIRCYYCWRHFEDKRSLRSHLNGCLQLVSPEFNNPTAAPSVSLQKCWKCRESFFRKDALGQHRLSSQQKAFECEKCSRSIESHRTLKKNMLVDADPFQCSFCVKKFSTFEDKTVHEEVHPAVIIKTEENDVYDKRSEKSGDLRHHEEINAAVIVKTEKNDVCGGNSEKSGELMHHDLMDKCKGIFACTVCPSKFKRNYSLRRHVKNVHKRIEPFFCRICSEAFEVKADLNNHLKSHRNEKSYRCEICFKAFQDGTCLKSHMRSHSDARPYACTLCDATFKHLSSKQCHVQNVHLDVRNYKCHLCSKAFTRKYHLERHLEGHGDIRAYQCDICPRSFKVDTGLRSHKLVHHTEGKPFPCEFCPMTFKTSFYRNSHVKRVHAEGTPFICETCGEGFRNKSLLESHLEKHSDLKYYRALYLREKVSVD